MSAPIPSPLYQEAYRGIRFYQTHTGVWLFHDFLPGAALRWAYWDRFFTDEERAAEFTPEAMRRAIDRAHADSPCYSGDIRFRK